MNAAAAELGTTPASPPARAIRPPPWIFTNLARPNQDPVVNVATVLLILISVVPIWLAQRLSEATVRGRAGRRPAGLHRRTLAPSAVE